MNGSGSFLLRITVYDVLEYLASGMTHEEIFEDFPYLAQTNIFACLSFATKRDRISTTPCIPS